MQRHKHDVVIVGAGSGGYAAARTSHDFGCDVAMIDSGPLGGLCILRGCMPSKALIASSDALYDAREAVKLGIRASGLHADLPAIFERKRTLVKEFADYRIEGIERFPLYMGQARFLSPNEVAVGEDDVVEGKQFVIASGSVVPPSALTGLTETGYVDTDAVLELERIPESVIVLGGGYTACELGQFLARMGAKTTILIRSDHLLTQEDDDVGTALTHYFTEEGIDVVTGTTLLSAQRRGDKKAIQYTAGGEQRLAVADEIFYALGRVPNVAGFDLDRAGVAYHAIKGIDVDATLRTSNPNIYAVGDVTGEHMLVHVAIYQGEVAARNACLQGKEEADYRLITTHAVFCDPQVAAVGKTEKVLLREGIRYVRGSYDFAEHGKAQCLGKTKGFVKMMADAADGRILGAAVIGPQASELIHEVIVAMNFNSTVAEFMRIPHLHPTLAEIWTYPAEECAAQLGMKVPGDEQMELATSVDATSR
ncbi:MAG TPA: dihydrolipoyl dehydrogenase [Candidatus Baltobacteraceae bacterium]|jgi:pyruvate/2-oxoglutarate dehydrogenase complex dihydrolipoamide dehydrogenase (E3) component|nr:dihydrolipoyl dehydrogenase [Candidatus Baltobacteraceae bacterium]